MISVTQIRSQARPRTSSEGWFCCDDRSFLPEVRDLAERRLREIVVEARRHIWRAGAHRL
ncbi:MAG: hypothetical protein R3D53_08925 [Paracoccaceae bacterium]